MSLEQELMEQEEKLDKKATEKVEEKKKSDDDLTDEEIQAVKELKEAEWYKVLCDCVEKRIKQFKEKTIEPLMIDNCFTPKQHSWISIYEVFGSFISWMNEFKKIADVITIDPEELQKAIDETNKAEQELLSDKQDEEN